MLAASLLCLAGDPHRVPEPPPRVWYVDAGDTALDYKIAPSAVGCPSESEFRDRTADLYDFEDPFVPKLLRARTLVRVDVARTAAGYRGVILVINPETGDVLNESSEIYYDRCDDLVWILSHRMRMIVSPRQKKQAPAPTPAPAPVNDPATNRRLDSHEEDIEDQQAQIDALRREIHELKKRIKETGQVDLTYALSAGAFITANLTSNVGPGLWVGGELRAGPLALGLELRTVLPSRVEVGPYDFDMSQYVALLTPCGRYSYFFGCGIAGVGMQYSKDSNFPGGANDDIAPLIQLGGRIGAEVPFGDSPLAGRAWGEVLYSTPQTEIDYIGSPYKSLRPDVSAFFGVGLVVRFGKEGT